MPDYLAPLHGVSLSEALAEAAAIAPVTRAMLSAFELWHPLLAEPVRIVNDHANLLATLEADAPRDAGLEVEFLACAVRVTRPEESDTAGAPEITLSAANVSGLLSDALKLTRGSMDSWTIIERIYASDDTTGPAILPPMTLTLTGASLTGAGASIVASFGDAVNTLVPKTTFKIEEYAGLLF